MWPFWLQVQMCLTFERDSIVLSTRLKAYGRREIRRFIQGIGESLSTVDFISFVPYDTERMGRGHIFDFTCQGIALVFAHHIIGASAGADADGFWEYWTKK